MAELKFGQVWRDNEDGETLMVVSTDRDKIDVVVLAPNPTDNEGIGDLSDAPLYYFENTSTTDWELLDD